MDRKTFLRQGILGTGMIVTSGISSNILNNDIDELKPLKVLDDKTLGFNHIPHTNSNIMDNKVLHKADSRGNANHGWLNSFHTFSFANYYNPERMHFGVLRVLNDDTVSGGMGFNTHPHDNMEIISIPLEGDLEHKDSMGNIAVIRNGDIQVMSAGTGIQHSEKNKNRDKEVKFLQIWLFPNKKNVTPRYDQLSLIAEDRHNKLQQILSPDPNDEGVWIHQDAWFHLGSFEKDINQSYTLKKNGNGVYVFVISGSITIDDQNLSARDGLGMWDTKQFSFTSDSQAEVLIMEVPMAV